MWAEGMHTTANQKPWKCPLISPILNPFMSRGLQEHPVKGGQKPRLESQTESDGVGS